MIFALFFFPLLCPTSLITIDSGQLMKKETIPFFINTTITTTLFMLISDIHVKIPDFKYKKKYIEATLDNSHPQEKSNSSFQLSSQVGAVLKNSIRVLAQTEKSVYTMMMEKEY